MGTNGQLCVQYRYTGKGVVDTPGRMEKRGMKFHHTNWSRKQLKFMSYLFPVFSTSYFWIVGNWRHGNLDYGETTAEACKPRNGSCGFSEAVFKNKDLLYVLTVRMCVLCVDVGTGVQVPAETSDPSRAGVTSGGGPPSARAAHIQDCFSHRSSPSLKQS